LSPAKLSLERRIVYAHQRSGWAYALQSLQPLLVEPPVAGVLFDSMLERNFARELPAALSERRIPYLRPWVGAIHAPAGIPDTTDQSKSPLRISQLPAWRESLPYCRGLITFSRHHASFLRGHVPGVPVLALRHPTESPEGRFSFEDYLRRGEPVVQVGWWLRRLTSIHLLPLPRSRKHLLIPTVPSDQARFLGVLEAERAAANAPPLDQWDATILARLPNQEYDGVLSGSLVFLDLYDSVANNAIIECIVRHTPILVNPLPSVREYLGEDYPLYFSDLEEAARKAADANLVLAAHRHLAAIDPAFLSGDTFRRELAESALYQALPSP